MQTRKIVNRILEELNEQERSQGWLSKKTGIAVSSLNNYVRNKRKIPHDSLYLIAEALKVTTDSLLVEEKTTA